MVFNDNGRYSRASEDRNHLWVQPRTTWAEVADGGCEKKCLTSRMIRKGGSLIEEMRALSLS